MRILVRTSGWAIWARRWASFAVPLIVIPIIMHRFGYLQSQTFELIEMLAAGVAMLAVVVAMIALVRLWITGDRGWGKAISGLFLGLICLLPFAFVGALFLTSPKVSDVSTDPVDPPSIIGLPAMPAQSEEQVAEIAEAFPSVQTRSYSLGGRIIYPLVETLVGDRGWEVLDASPPTTGLAEGHINAIETTLLGWRDQVAIRVVGEVEGARVDMRSASLSPSESDLGNNGKRIEAFLGALDNAVTQLMRENPSGVAEPEEEQRLTVDPETGAPIPADRPPGL